MPSPYRLPARRIPDEPRRRREEPSAASFVFFLCIGALGLLVLQAALVH